MLIEVANSRSRASATGEGNFTVIRTPELQPAGVTVYRLDYPIPNFGSFNISSCNRKNSVPRKRAPDLWPGPYRVGKITVKGAAAEDMTKRRNRAARCMTVCPPPCWYIRTEWWTLAA